MKNFHTSFTWLLLLLFILMQVVPMAAAADQYSQPVTPPAGNLPGAANNSAGALAVVADNMANYYFNLYKDSWGWDWLKTTNVNFSAFSGGTPQWNLNTFQPLTLKDNLDNFLFLQGQYGTGNNTLNAGLGYRALSSTRSAIYGVNVFYDWQTAVSGINGYNPTGNGHMRVGAGLEYFTGPLEFRANGYWGVSSDVMTGRALASDGLTAVQTWQHVAPGGDVSVGTDFTFWQAPWLKLTATGNYYGQTQNGTINGYQGSAMYGNLTAQLQVTPQLSINGGGSAGNGNPSSANIGFQFNLLAPPAPAIFMAEPGMNERAATDISYKMLQAVQRNNAVTVEQYQKQVTSATTSYAIIVNDSNGLPMAGVNTLFSYSKVTAVVTNNAVTQSATSDIHGKVTFVLPEGAIPSAFSANIGETSVAVTDFSTFNKTVQLPVTGTVVLSGQNIQALANGTAAVYKIGSAQPLNFAYTLDKPSYYRSANGSVLLRGLNPGESYIIKIIHDGVTDVLPQQTASSAPNNATPVDVDDNISLVGSGSAGPVTMQAYYSDGSTGYPGLVVYLRTGGGFGGTSIKATTNANGLATFINVPYGQYRITFDNEQLSTIDNIILSADAPSKTAQVIVPEPAPLMNGAVNIGGIKYSEVDDNLATGTNIQLLNTANGVTYTKDYSSSGTQFVNLPVGATYTLWALLPTGAVQIATVDPIVVSDNTPVSVNGATIAGSPAALGVVNLTLTADGVAVNAGSEYGLTDASGNVVVTGMITSGNTVNIPNLAAGTYHAYLGNAIVGENKVISGYVYRGTAFAVTTGQTTAVTLNGITSQFNVTTKQANGSIAAATIVNITPTLNQATPSGNMRITTDSYGTQAVWLWATSDLAASYNFQTIIDAKSVSIAAIAPAQTATNLLLQPNAQELANSGSISGLLAVDGVDNYYGTLITLNPAPAAVPQVTVDADGVFKISNISAGTYNLAITVPGYQTNSLATPYSVTAGSDTVTGTLLADFVKVPVTLTGKITDAATGTALANVTVYLGRGSSLPIQTLTDALGNYSFGEYTLNSGFCTVMVMADSGYDYNSVTKTLQDGANTVNVSMSKVLY